MSSSGLDRMLLSFEVSGETVQQLSSADQPPAVSLLLAGLDGIARLDLDALPVETAAAVTAAVVSGHERVQALAVQAVCAVQSRELYRQDGAGSTTAWLAQQQSSLPPALVALGRKLDAVPQPPIRSPDARSASTLRSRWRVRWTGSVPTSTGQTA